MISTGGAAYRPPTLRKPILNGGARSPAVRLRAPNAGFNGGARAPATVSHPPNAGFNGGAAAPPATALPPIGTPAPASPAPIPLDAQYFNDWASEQFKANAQRTQLLSAHDLDVSQRDQSLQQLAERQPVLKQQATDQANARGLLYSGALGNQIGELASKYTQDTGEISNAFGQREADRQLQLRALEDGLPLQRLAMELASIDRARQAAADAALLAPQMPGATGGGGGAVARARGHSAQYAGPGFYRAAGPASTAVRAVGHSVSYRGPGHYVPVKRK